METIRCGIWFAVANGLLWHPGSGIGDAQAKKAPQGVNKDAIAKRMRVSATRPRSGWKITLDYPQLKLIIDRVLSVG
ncbi:hypothetical protein H6F74_04245 [Trichocoleus sp. FACHB-90]|uniref:hypothetical protein n=1 Tax=Cyanophyceae TaxID=3028117 RepID=UPI0016886332|nr:hypothetical protein [Trichocoleus sp. FACHB-90]MBD1925497.1 hypothetical protein [Trichocoleus sp. FACHB-90]